MECTPLPERRMTGYDPAVRRPVRHSPYDGRAQPRNSRSVAMSKTHAASMAVGLGLLIFSGASFDVAAKSSGVAARPSQPTQSTPAPRPAAPGHHGAFRRFPL